MRLVCSSAEEIHVSQSRHLSASVCPFSQLRAGETAAVVARELAEQTKRNLQAGDITFTVKAMVQLVDLLDVQLRNLTPGGKDSAARSLNKVASANL